MADMAIVIPQALTEGDPQDLPLKLKVVDNGDGTWSWAISGSFDTSALATWAKQDTTNMKLEDVRLLLEQIYNGPITVEGSLEISNDVGNPIPVNGTVGINPLAKDVDANMQIGGDDVSPTNPVHITGTVTSSGAGLSASNALTLSAYNLNAAAYSGTTVISNDYQLSLLKLHFSTGAKKTITLTSSGGEVVYKDEDSTEQDYAIPFDTIFNGGDNLTLAITQTTSACTVTGNVIVGQGSLALEGNPVVEQAFPFNVRSMSRFYNIRGERHIATTGYVTQTANTAGELIAMFRNPTGSGKVVLFDKAEFGSSANTRFSRYGSGTITLIGTPTKRPIGRTDGGTSTSPMEIYLGGKTSPQFTATGGTLRKVAFMQAYAQYQLNEIDGTIIMQPGQNAYWAVDEPAGGGGTDYQTLIDFEWIEMDLATYNNMVTVLLAQAGY